MQCTRHLEMKTMIKNKYIESYLVVAKKLDFEIVIRDGHILDGTGNPWFKANIGITDGRISRISRSDLKQAEKTIDANGLIVCPGFINIHSHSDSGIHFQYVFSSSISL